MENYLGVDDIQFCLLNILDLVSSIKIVSFSAAEKAVILLSSQCRPASYIMVNMGVASFPSIKAKGGRLSHLLFQWLKSTASSFLIENPPPGKCIL